MLLALPLALGADVSDGLQMRLYDKGLDVGKSLVEGETFNLQYDDVGAEYDCWDYVGVKNVDLDIPIDSIEAQLDDDVVHLTVHFGEIYGEDWEVYSIDADYLDTCLEFDFDVLYVRLTNAVMKADLSVGIKQGQVEFAVKGTPSLTGEFDSDVDNFPDDLTLYFFEDEVLGAIADGVGSYVPGVLNDYVNEALLGGDYGDYAMAFDVADVSVSPKRLAVVASGAVDYLGDDGCPNRDDPRNDGRSPEIDLGEGSESALAVGLTEKMVNEVFRVLWRDGWFCFTEQNVSQFLSSVQDVFDPDVGGLSASVALESPPEVRIEADGAYVTLVGLDVEIDGTLKGRSEKLLDASLDLSATLDVGVDNAQSAFTLSARDLALSFERFDAKHLVSSEKGAEQELQAFLESWVGTWIESQAQDLVLFSTLYDVLGLVVRVDELGWQEGGVKLYLSVFSADDPEVDRRAPDTDAEVTSGQGGARLTWSGSDDRKGDLAFSYALDGGAYSSWSTEDGVTLTGLPSGQHSVQVVARDSWWNVDTSPAKLSFDTENLPDPETEEAGCGCAAMPVATIWTWTAGIVGLIAARRRPR
jgi:hypothetical protein